MVAADIPKTYIIILFRCFNAFRNSHHCGQVLVWLCNVGRYLCNYHRLVLTSTGLDPTLCVSLNGVCTWIPNCTYTLQDLGWISTGSIHYVHNLYSRCVLDAPYALIVHLPLNDTFRLKDMQKHGIQVVLI